MKRPRTIPAGSPRAASGFTLIEILVALAVLSLGILGYMALQFHSVQSRVYARGMNSALATGATDLEDKLARNFNSLSAGGVEYRFKKDFSSGATPYDFDCGNAYKIEASVADWGQVSANVNAALRELKTVHAVVRWREKGIQEYSSRLVTFERGGKPGDT